MPPAPKTPLKNPPTRTALFIYLGLFLTTFLLYSSVHTFSFVDFDDPDYGASPHVREGLTSSSLTWALTSGEASNWLPVTRLSHILDAQFFGLDSGWPHLINVLFHALATLLLFTFLRRTTGAVWRSALVALLFAVHPLHVESVAWVAERKDVLCAFFWFLTLYAYVRYAERPTLSRYLLTLAPFCLGLMSKPMMITLPLVLLLLDVWPLRRVALWEKVPFLLLSAATAVVAVMTQAGSGAIAMLHVPLPVRIENALVSYLVYIEKMFWPTNLAVLYPFLSHIPAWQPALAATAIGAVSLLVVRLRRTQPHWMVGWFWYLASLIPVIGLVQIGVQSHADRYMYIPMVGLLIMLAWALAAVVDRWPQARTAVVASVGATCLLLAARADAQIQYWKNSEALYRRAIAVTESNYTMHYGLGVLLGRTPGRLPEAISEYQAAVEEKPDYVDARGNLAAALMDIAGRLPEAIAEYQAALQFEPNSATLHNNLGIALSRVPGHLDEAIAHFQTAVRIKPAFVEAHNNLAATLLKAPGRLPKAIAEYQTALRLQPESLEAHTGLAFALSNSPGRTNEAVSEYQAALQIDPHSLEAHYNLALLLVNTPGRAAEAIPHLQAVLQLRPDPKVRQLLDRLQAARSPC